MDKKICVGLVVKGGKEFIDHWIECVEKIADLIVVVDNNADKEVRELLIDHPLVKSYTKQTLKRSNGRDYQLILEQARKFDVKWIWNIDIDEIVDFPQDFDKDEFADYICASNQETYTFPLFEMRNDKDHFTHIRTCPKLYRSFSHFKFVERDTYGGPIPDNCIA